MAACWSFHEVARVFHDRGSFGLTIAYAYVRSTETTWWSIVPLRPSLLVNESPEGHNYIWFDAVGRIVGTSFETHTGVRHGAYLGYHINGGIAHIGQYAEGKQQGVWRAYSHFSTACPLPCQR
jgi:hypothetical protein